MICRVYFTNKCKNSFNLYVIIWSYGGYKSSLTGSNNVLSGRYTENFKLSFGLNLFGPYERIILKKCSCIWINT